MPERKHNERSDDRWHLRKEVHIGHILAFLTFTFMAIAVYIDADRRIDKNTLANEYQDKMLKEHIRTVEKTFSGISDDVREIRTVITEEYRNRK